MDYLIKIKDLSFSYGQLEVFDNLNLTIYPHDYITFLGANGSGKTTLMKLILGSLKPDQGEIIINNYSLKELKKQGLIGYVPQSGLLSVIDFPLTVSELILLKTKQLNYFSFYHNKHHPKLLEVLTLVDLTSKKDVLLRNLSGGQLQKALIARELFNQPKILFLDEPTSGLDLTAMHELKEILANLNQQGLTIIEVSHEASDFEKCETRKILFKNQKIEEISC